MTEKIRVMLVDDHSLCRSGLKELLEHRGGMSVVSTTGDPNQVVPLIREHKPQLLNRIMPVAMTVTTNTNPYSSKNAFIRSPPFQTWSSGYSSLP